MKKGKRPIRLPRPGLIEPRKLSKPEIKRLMRQLTAVRDWLDTQIVVLTCGLKRSETL